MHVVILILELDEALSIRIALREDIGNMMLHDHHCFVGIHTIVPEVCVCVQEIP